MTTIRFVHCADLHIDRPLERISDIDSILGELLRQSTYQSFCNIIDVAIEEKVDCVVISGDIYDSANRSLHAQLRFRDGLNRLSENGIATYIVHGNHDPLDSWSNKLDWPDNVFIFPGKSVVCYPLVRDGEIIAEICGISFKKRDIYENLVPQFPADSGEIPRIGLLHTNVGTNTGHASYAPASIADLSSAGIDYWALGHIHRYGVLQANDPAIVYPGCSQSTQPREFGEKGCCLVTLSRSIEPEIQFIATDIIRYKTDSIDISNCMTVDDVIALINDKCEFVLAEENGRHVVLRLTLSGRGDLDSELRRGNTMEDILSHIREYWEDRSPRVWIDKLNLTTAGTFNIELLRRGKDFLSDIVTIYDELENPRSEHWEHVHERLEALFTNWRGQKYLDPIVDVNLIELAREARDWSLNMLVKPE